MSSELDLTGFLREASVPDLSWLDVDEAEYRRQEPLPKQNLDVVPDLEALWAHEDKPSTSYVPNTGAPKTMGDLSEHHGRLSPRPDDLLRTIRLAMMQSDDLGRLRSELVGRFGMDALRENHQVLASALKERGLLGRLYIDAQDFPGCDRGRGPQFVSKYASGAQYVLAKKACGGCCHKSTTTAGKQMCGQFQKELKIEVPFTPELAEQIERAQASMGRQVQANDSQPARERIRQAYLAGPAKQRDPSYIGVGVDKRPRVASMSQAQVQGELISAASLVRGKRAAEKAEIEAKPIVTFLHREMVKGLTAAEVATSLRVGFSREVLSRTQAHWAPLVKEAGLLGVVYTKQGSFDDCHEGADFLAKHNPEVRVVVAGAKCGACVYNKGRCMLYGKPLIKSASEVLTQETVEAVLQEHKMSGRLQPWDTKIASTWGSTPAEALKAIHVATRAPSVAYAPQRQVSQQGFYGGSPRELKLEPTLSAPARQAKRYMNEGLYGEDLLGLMRTKFAKVDLVKAAPELRTVLAEQGLQGIFYVDPTIYEDYGKCNEAERLHSTRMVPYLKVGSKCHGCVHQVQQGFCSKIRKALVYEPPYTDKRAQQRAVLASGRTTVTAYEDIMNNGTSMMAEYQMQQPLTVDVGREEKPFEASVFLGTGEIKL